MESDSEMATEAHNESTSGPSIAWFEFILDESLLERHLANTDPKPSAASLISLFLYQADIATNIAREIIGKENLANNGTTENAVVENKKIRILRLLAVKTACYLEWNLGKLEKALPVSILRSLLEELLKIVPCAQDLSIKSHPQLDLATLPPETLFAVLLYHRWALMTVIKNSFPVKPSKVVNVQVPGILDPSVTSAVMKDVVLKSLSEDISISISVLERYLAIAGGRETLLPVASCIGSVNSDTDEIFHCWSNGTHIDDAEMSGQVSYDVGCAHFYQQNYEKADAAFQNCSRLLAKISDPVFLDVDKSRLGGYVCACGGILGRLTSGISDRPTTLYQRVVTSVQDSFKGLTPLLVEDLIRQELSWTFRASLEESAHLAKRTDSLYEEVVVCNAVRRSLDGHVSVLDLVRTLNRTSGLLDFLFQICVDISRSISAAQKENLKLFLRNLCYTLSSTTNFSARLAACDLASLFTESEQSELKAFGGDGNVPVATLQTSFSFPPPVDAKLAVGELERQLLVTYDPAAVRALVPDLARKIGNNQTVYLTDKWMLPRELQQSIVSLPIPEPTLAMVTHVLVAKSRICVQLRQYDKARELLFAADIEIKDVSYKLSKILRWETLKVDLLQCIEAERAAPEQVLLELGKRCKTCITSLQLENVDMQPSAELLSLCVAFLLNVKDWDYLSGLSNMATSGAIHFGQLLAVLCREVPQLKPARNSASKFMESVSLAFAENVSSLKRNTSSVTLGQLQRDAGAPSPILTQEALTAFIGKIKEPVVLSLFVSCLTKLFALVTIDVTEEIFSDYVMLWPATLPIPLSAASVCEMVTWLLGHVLSVNPRHSSWLRTHADFVFAQGQYWLALRYYLQLGIVTTDFFTEPVTKNAYNDQVYRRMIRCCTQLNCHTQVAVLCQFFDEVDYTVAFKALQERVTHDAMDTYYDCIWDTTILEFLINLHAKRGERDKSNYVLRLIGQPELNSNNREDIVNEAERVRKSRFLRTMARQYLGVNLPQTVAPPGTG